MWCRPGATIFVWCMFVLPRLAHAATYTDVWVVEINGGEEEARAIATRNGFVYAGKFQPGFYEFQIRQVAKRSMHHSWYNHESLAKEPKVRGLRQQMVKRIAKRELYFNDPGWEKSWFNADGNPLGMSVEEAWEMGVTGKDIVVSILDDGLDYNHPDLKKNYDSKASYDFNDNDRDPMPRYTWENSHGTRMAGILAAEANNSICGLGIAFNVKVGEIRMLDGRVTDSVQAEALGFKPQYVDIYCFSWLYSTDGTSVLGPGSSASRALEEGTRLGRGRLGSIYVWGIWQQGFRPIQCDGYASSIHTITINIAHNDWGVYCTATLAAIFSATRTTAPYWHKTLMTTSLYDTCEERFNHTRYTAPQAAGICALTLEANPNLTWRDMQHIIVATANNTMFGLEVDEEWITNGVGKLVNPEFGFGVMNASAMVEMARDWITVPEQRTCLIKADDTNQVVPVGSSITFKLETNWCSRGAPNHVIFLEHVQVRMTLTATQPIEVEIFLVSPMGTRSTLRSKKIMIKDYLNPPDFNDWTIMTTHNWGEYANGTWSLTIASGNSPDVELKEWTLILYGTEQAPQ